MGEKRLDLKTGFICNNNCIFCVQAHNKYKGNRPIEELKKDLDESRKRCDAIVFTGGEVTIRKDLFELIEYAKNLNYKTIQIQSNHRMLSNLDFCKKIIVAGANEFVPAVHGPTAEVHDGLTNAPGSFYQSVKAIQNLKKLNQRVIVNSVVTKSNYKHLPATAKLFVKLNVDLFQFAFVHPMGNAYKNFEEVVPKISLAAPYIHKGLQVGIDNGVRCFAEAMPFCMMKGYEKNISEKYIPDTEIKTGLDFDENFTKTRQAEGKAKFLQCKECKYDYVCEGPWREYPEKYGSEEFKAVKWKK
jgi:molybdenum cofactor biosynthesis enzyme MoaA